MVDNTGFVSDDYGFSDQALVRHLLQARSTVLTGALRAGEDITEHSVQVLPCVDVCRLDRVDCPCAPASGCYWSKTVEPIPASIRIISVTDLKGGHTFAFRKWSHFEYIRDARIPSVKRGRYYTIRDSGKGAFLYIYNVQESESEFIKAVSVSSIFEDPMLAAAFPSCLEVDIQAKCNPLDVDFYTDSRYRDIIMNAAWNSIKGVRQQVYSARLNEDIKTQAPV